MKGVPAVTSAQMMDLDRRMLEHYHIDLLQMMENAGRALALQSKRLLGGSLAGKRIVVIVGKGNNGGGGLASARHMHNWGADVEIVLSSKRNELKQAPRKQMETLEIMNLLIHQETAKPDLSRFNLIIDALLGYNQKGNPHGKVAELIGLANSSGRKILALDIPSGLDPNTGKPNDPCVRASQTLTLALPKKGLLKPKATHYVGRLFLADISVPREVYNGLGMDQRSVFGSDFIVALN
jgi:NAD(P)H-hydrate epimerase